MLVTAIDLVDEYSLKTNILYIGMKLRFSLLWVNFANRCKLFEFFRGNNFLELYLEEYFAGI